MRGAASRRIPNHLSPQGCRLGPTAGTLAAIAGDEPLARTEMVKRVWAYMREHGCQDQADRREIVCDDRLCAVFGRNRFNMLAMMRLLSPHLRST